MDFLDSLLSTMDKPQPKTAKQIEADKLQKALAKRISDDDKKIKERFRQENWRKLREFVNDPAQSILVLEPMDNVFRGIIHELAQEQDIVALGFGDETVCRQVVLFKQMSAPTQDELYFMNRDLLYAACMADFKEKEEHRRLKAALREEASERGPHEKAPKKSAAEKRKQESMVEMVAVRPSGVGEVTLAQKLDTRSVDEAMSDIRRAKQAKLEPAPKAS